MKLESFTNNDGKIQGYVFHCPGCNNPHAVFIQPHKSPNGASWSFNGDLTAPTFSPSLIQRIEYTDGRVEICHLFVKNGKLEFLNDCTHSMAGITVEMPDIGEVD
ncbi:DUF6527 family protein [Calothrix sp. 336/3]|uniref:DUF6527 family protein n=1 Tax=Calothrix sp. 336/3 TaxID=1337936 RepID=UPI000624DBF1|nr:DUF6527 family protein [Calothrix sp. 336/3]AKG21238.1 hypothetical protein IJ00_07960 [Calothrix sp. 336/3]